VEEMVDLGMMKKKRKVEMVRNLEEEGNGGGCCW